MKHEILQDPVRGKLLFLTDGTTEVKLALDYGIRILSLSLTGKENLYYEQPADCSDGLCMPEGWRIYGGHRLWAAPESMKSYYPDNDPVDYTVTDTGAELLQKEDPWLGLRKRLRLDFEPDGSILITQGMTNVSAAPVTLASWGVNTLDGGGKAEIWFDGGTKGCFNPERVLTLWDHTSLGDPRLRFTDERIYAEHQPLDAYLKLGISSASGKAVFRSKGQELELTLGYDRSLTYPDGGCNFELYMDRNVTELETLGPVKTLAPGEEASHWERWRLKPL